MPEHAVEPVYTAYERFVSERTLRRTQTNQPMQVRVGLPPAIQSPPAERVTRDVKLLAPQCTGSHRGLRYAVRVDRQACSLSESVEARVKMGADCVFLYLHGRALDTTDLRYAMLTCVVPRNSDPRKFHFQIGPLFPQSEPSDLLPLIGDSGTEPLVARHRPSSWVLRVRLWERGDSLDWRSQGNVPPMLDLPAADNAVKAGMAPTAPPAATISTLVNLLPTCRVDFDATGATRSPDPSDDNTSRDATPDSDYSPVPGAPTDDDAVESDADPEVLDALVTRFRDRLAGYDRARGRFTLVADAEDAEWIDALAHRVALDALKPPETAMPMVVAALATKQRPPVPHSSHLVRTIDPRWGLSTAQRFRSGSHTDTDFLRGSVYAVTNEDPLPQREEPFIAEDPVTWTDAAADHDDPEATRSPSAGFIGDGLSRSVA